MAVPPEMSSPVTFSHRRTTSPNSGGPVRSVTPWPAACTITLVTPSLVAATANPASSRSNRRSRISTPVTSALSSSFVAGAAEEVNPASRRTVLRAPSQPTTYRALIRRSASGPRTPQTTWSGRSVISVSWFARSRVAPSRSARSPRTASVRYWGTFQLPAYSLSRPDRSNPSPAKCARGSRVASPSSAPNPRSCRSSAVSVVSWLARDSVIGLARRSTMTTGTLARLSSQASRSPTGPAPTMTTCAAAGGRVTTRRACSRSPRRRPSRRAGWSGCCRSGRYGRTAARSARPRRRRARRRSAPC